MTRAGALRKAPLWGAFFVVWMLLAGGAHAECAPDRIDESVRVRQVLDGDTVILGDNRHLRFIGVNTPEIAHHGQPAQPYGIAARDALRKALAARHNTLNLRYDTERYDRYGRALAHVFFSDGDSVAAWLQTQGLGTVSVVPPNEWNSACYQMVEQRARTAHRGIWAHPDYQVMESTQLASGTEGYRLIAGRVQHIGGSRDALWLDLEGGVALRIDREDLRYFREMQPQTLAGRRVLARGWLHRDRRGAHMNLRHPSALQVLNQ